MSKTPHEINDNEIRIISSEQSHESMSRRKPPYKTWSAAIAIIAIILALIAIIILCFSLTDKNNSEGPDNLEVTTDTADAASIVNDPTDNSVTFDTIMPNHGFVEMKDTVLNKASLTILTPRNLTPSLHLGSEILSDSDAVMAFQAADIRRDNGGIVGAYVLNGELISRGQSKSGFCAIINGKLTLGVADATPYLEQAIENDGYFFRQYPLVVGGQVVENKLKTSSLRKALAELNGETVVILSHRKMTLNEFSQTLADLGVSNAIYLVGSSAYGIAVDKDGNRIEFGLERPNPAENTNYIVWRS